MHDQLFIEQIVRCTNLDLAAQGKLKRVLGQIDQDLFQTYLVAHQLVGQADVLLGRIQELVELALGIFEHRHRLEA